MESACNETMAGETVMSPVRISDKMPARLLRRRKLDITLWQTITAMRCLSNKGVYVYFARDIVGEIDQRMATNQITPMLNILHNRGLLKCITPGQTKHRQFRVLDWPALDKFQVMHAEHPEQLRPPIDWLSVRRQPLEICNTDEYEIVEPEEIEEERRTIRSDGSTAPRTGSILRSVPHTNGRKKVGWFKRTFTNAELVEEVRETNRRLEKLLEVWS